jgi:hypothetical protein
VKPTQHFIKFFRQLPGLSARVLNEADWSALLSVEDREEFRSKVDEYFPSLTEAQKDRMAQFIYDKNQELLREAREEAAETEGGDPSDGAA